MMTIRVKGKVPAAIDRYNGTINQFIYDTWKDQPVEPYGRVIKGYGTEAPYDRDHVAVRLALPGIAACSAVALDEIDGPFDVASLPPHPSHRGSRWRVYNPDNAFGY